MKEQPERKQEENVWYERERLIRTLSGLVVAIGGCVLAITRPEYAYLGVGAALIGAGLIEPTQLFPLLTSKKKKEE
jgi:hypothetical protein